MLLDSFSADLRAYEAAEDRLAWRDEANAQAAAWIAQSVIANLDGRRDQFIEWLFDRPGAASLISDLLDEMHGGAADISQPLHRSIDSFALETANEEARYD